MGDDVFRKRCEDATEGSPEEAEEEKALVGTNPWERLWRKSKLRPRQSGNDARMHGNTTRSSLAEHAPRISSCRDITENGQLWVAGMTPIGPLRTSTTINPDFIIT